MASGRPIVATDLPTHTEVLSVETAVLTPPTVAGLAQGISRALDEPPFAARLGERARSVAESEYTYSKFKQQLSAAYTALVYPRLIGLEVSPPAAS